ncbi:hypothetical protein A8135_06390 [Legionella jamestowniensis]|uniref:Uncharacterized protein n=1 Tax=Legionella jamestowniensis TaxID=455 RepID=A0ABX2XV21_9GAMM|nr:hypothetical protein [Legionella jamestowniensis]OCH96781.1 hypothetical protein A8135_06390 [Legionella jamestowniensis]
MNVKSRLSLLFLVVGIVNTALALTVNQWKLSPDGLGPIKIGMTLKEVAKIKGLQLSGNKPDAYESERCYTETLKGVKHVLLMISNGKVVRISISSPKIYTSKGAHIGDSEAKVQALYSDKLAVEKHRYEEKGHYLTFVVKQPQERAIRFETDGKKITRIYAGQAPEVYYVEDCL